jgi:hypothetical protein
MTRRAQKQAADTVQPAAGTALDVRAPFAPSPEFVAAMQALSPRHAMFVRAYLRSGNGAAAATAAGFAPKHAASRAWKLLRLPKVQAAIQAAHAMTAQGAAYDLQRGMAEAEAGIAFARETKNATAMIKGIELRLRLHGLLVDKSEIRFPQVDISGALAEANARTLPKPPIDVTPTRVADIFKD